VHFQGSLPETVSKTKLKEPFALFPITRSKIRFCVTSHPNLEEANKLEQQLFFFRKEAKSVVLLRRRLQDTQKIAPQG
jgi:hypothetical protein